VKGALALAAGAVAGILLSGVVSAALIPFLPPALRGVPLVCATTIVVVALAVFAAYRLSAPRSE
jgi:hypothetical protein